MASQNIAAKAATAGFPAFADNTKLRLLVGTLLYLAQGFPQGIFFGAIPVWLAANGQSTAIVAAASAAAALPWSFKFLAGLFMDRYTWLPMGRRRPWLIGSQSGIIVCLLFTAIISPSASDTTVIISFIVIVSTLIAVHYVALDALVVDLTPADEMGRMNGFMFGGKVFGIAGGMAGASFLLETYGFSSAMLGMIACFAIPAFIAIVVRERDGEKLLPWTAGSISKESKSISGDNWLTILRAVFWNLFQRQPILVVCILLIFGVHQGLNDTTSGLFAIRELGWSQSELSSMVATYNIILGIFCITVGGWMVDRFGPERITFWSGAAALPIMAGYLVDTALWQNSQLFIAWYGLKSAPLFLFYLATLVMAMRVTAPQVAATSFSVFMALASLGVVIAASILPSLEDFGGFQAMFGASALLVFLAGMLTLLLKKCPSPEASVLH